MNETDKRVGRDFSVVLKNVECVACGAVLLAFESLGPSPMGREECPNCGQESFEFVE